MSDFKLHGASPEKVSISRQTMEDIASFLEVELRDGEFESNFEYEKTREIYEECRKSLEERSSQGIVWHPFPDELPPEDVLMIVKLKSDYLAFAKFHKYPEGHCWGYQDGGDWPEALSEDVRFFRKFDQ